MKSISPFLRLKSAVLLCAVTAFTLALGGGDAMRDFNGGAHWLNGPAVSAGSLRGKVVLVDFWDYTCINCLRTLPYLREWYKRYHDRGFEIIGVHTPEFRFAGDDRNVESAVKRLDVTWPVVLDDGYAIWKRNDVTEWPTELLFDQNGTLVESQLGEGNYPQTEAKIQALLRKSNPHAAFPPVMALLPQDSYDKPGAVCYPQTPEVVVAHTPIANAPKFGDPSQDLNYSDSHARNDGSLYLDGFWHATKEAIAFGGGGGYAALPYHAIQVETVLVPQSGSTRVNVTQDGKPIAHADAGPDIRYDQNGMSYVTVDASRAYDIVMNAKFGEHELRLYPQGTGLGIYDFAFESCEVPSHT
ncbi:MAG TPA: redoxin family protein [Candidatus Baltobacteraceae bacterium]|jgi:thiol-disulfide isomerase/thioredoxin|nr:redoxin family protein [Candidatus Baltobacteraceae bacterium]